jgi:hypothetical protein
MNPVLREHFKIPPDISEVERWPGKYAHDICEMNPISIGLLQYIIDETDAEIVISSTWRKFCRGDDNCITWFKALFNEFGWEDAPVIGRTCDSNHGRRGFEVEKWLEDNDFDKQKDTFVIIDDDADMLTYQKNHHFVNTNFKNGITSEDADRAIEILNGEPPVEQLPLFDDIYFRHPEYDRYF